MPNRIAMNISFPSEEEKQEAIEKAKERGKTVSEMVQRYFKNLKHVN